MIKGFRDFIMRGNVVDLAVGIVIGAAFGKLVDQFVASFIQPLIKWITGGDEVSGTWRVNDAVVFDWGAFINVVITFLLTAAAVYFFVVVPINSRRPPSPPDDLSPEAALLTEIRDTLRHP